MHPLPLSSLIILFKIYGAPKSSIADFTCIIFHVCVTSEGFDILWEELQYHRKRLKICQNPINKEQQMSAESVGVHKKFLLVIFWIEKKKIEKILTINQCNIFILIVKYNLTIIILRIFLSWWSSSIWCEVLIYYCLFNACMENDMTLVNISSRLTIGNGSVRFRFRF